jgi:hypothetical protein
MAGNKKSKEAWKPVRGYEGRYKVSDRGRVYSSEGIVRKLRKDRYGYSIVDLRKNGVRKTVRVHRLVGEHFLSGDKSKQVNHDNGSKTDNRVENLDFKSPSENTQHSYDNGLQGRYTGKGGYVKGYSRRGKKGVSIVRSYKRNKKR